MGLQNRKFRRWVNMLRLWNRLVNMDDTRIPKAVFNHDFKSNTSPWCHEIKSIMGERSLYADRKTKEAQQQFPPVGYTLIKLKRSEAKQFEGEVKDGTLVPYKVLVEFHKFVKKAVKDLDDDCIKVKDHAQGPAISLIITHPRIGHKISVDLVPMIEIGKAKSILRKNKWPRNQTLAWLSGDNIKKIKDTKIYLVPKGDKFWKISFARCEDELLSVIGDKDKDMDGIRKKLLRICKGRLKEWKSKSVSDMKSLTSYLLKTLLLRLCEDLPDDEDWCAEQLSANYFHFMLYLQHCLKKRFLGEFFLPRINLLEAKDKCEIKVLLGCVKEELKAMGIGLISQSS